MKFKTMSYLKVAFYLFLAILPSAVKRFVYNNFLGAEIDPTAKIGMSYIQVNTFKMGPGARIKHFNKFRNLERLELGEQASIGNQNRFTALPLSSKKHFRTESERLPALIMGRHSAIVKGHFFDCNNTITIGEFAIVAGEGSAFFTHGIDLQTNTQTSAAIRIGNYSMVSARGVITKGAGLPDYSVLAANSTLHKSFVDGYTLYSGVPAQAVKTFDQNSEFFKRQEGHVG